MDRHGGGGMGGRGTGVDRSRGHGGNVQSWDAGCRCLVGGWSTGESMIHHVDVARVLGG